MPPSSAVATGDLATADDYNNLRTDVLSTHDHDGTDGNGTLNPNIVLFQDQSADPDALGELQLNGTTLKFYNGSTAVDLSGQAHAESHTVASHSDTTGTGAELEELTDGSTTVLHAHAGAQALWKHFALR